MLRQAWQTGRRPAQGRTNTTDQRGCGERSNRKGGPLRKPGSQEVLWWPFGGNDPLGFERWPDGPSHEQVQPMQPDLAAAIRDQYGWLPLEANTAT